MEHYAGIDVSLERSSVCVVEGSGKIVSEATDPEELPGEATVIVNFS
jgi:transposase